MIALLSGSVKGKFFGQVQGITYVMPEKDKPWKYRICINTLLFFAAQTAELEHGTCAVSAHAGGSLNSNINISAETKEVKRRWQ